MLNFNRFTTDFFLKIQLIFRMKTLIMKTKILEETLHGKNN